MLEFWEMALRDQGFSHGRRSCHWHGLWTFFGQPGLIPEVVSRAWQRRVVLALAMLWCAWISFMPRLCTGVAWTFPLASILVYFLTLIWSDLILECLVIPPAAWVAFECAVGGLGVWWGTVLHFEKMPWRAWIRILGPSLWPESFHKRQLQSWNWNWQPLHSLSKCQGFFPLKKTSILRGNWWPARGNLPLGTLDIMSELQAWLQEKDPNIYPDSTTISKILAIATMLQDYKSNRLQGMHFPVICLQRWRFGHSNDIHFGYQSMYRSLKTHHFLLWALSVLDGLSAMRPYAANLVMWWFFMWDLYSFVAFFQSVLILAYIGIYYRYLPFRSIAHFMKFMKHILRLAHWKLCVRRKKGIRDSEIVKRS